MGVSTSLDTNGIRGMKLTDCHNIDDFRALAKRRLPWPVFDYIDGAADDEVTRRRNRDAFDSCDLIPRVLAGMESVDMRTTLFGRERSEERREGKEVGGPRRSRWSQFLYKKNKAKLKIE